jgi:hypothetical protein
MSALFPLSDDLLPMDASSLKARQVEVALQQLKAASQDSTAHNVSGCCCCSGQPIGRGCREAPSCVCGFMFGCGCQPGVLCGYQCSLSWLDEELRALLLPTHMLHFVHWRPHSPMIRLVIGMDSSKCCSETVLTAAMACCKLPVWLRSVR